VPHILAALEGALQRVLDPIAALPGDVILSPDNLDGQYISPRAFEQHLASGYARVAQAASRHDKPLVVHVGGPIRHLLAPLAACGVDVVQGVAGPPQSDASLAEARVLAGPGLTLWGGIPQDLLLDTHDRADFEAAVRQAARQAAQDPRAIVGVSDRVPVDADLDRLCALPGLVAQA
jgi:uroporphyrinogen-III decarboxylase